MSPRRLGMLFVWLLAWGSPAATADVIYQYTGPDFQVFQGNPAPPTYGPSDHVSVTLSSPTLLPSSLPLDSDITPYLANFTFSDGVQIITNTTTLPTALLAATDNSGNIVSWVMEALVPPPPGDGSTNFSISTTFVQFGHNDFATTSVGCHFVGFQLVCPSAFVDTSPASGQPAGTWITIVPEPSTSLLLVTGVAGFAAMRRRLVNA